MAMVPGEKVVYKRLTSSSSAAFAFASGGCGCGAGYFTGYVALETCLFLVGWNRHRGAIWGGEERDVLDEEVQEEVVPIAIKNFVEMRHSPLAGSQSLALQSIVVRMEAYSTDGKRNSVGHGLAGEDQLSST